MSRSVTFRSGQNFDSTPQHKAGAVPDVGAILFGILFAEVFVQDLRDVLSL